MWSIFTPLIKFWLQLFILYIHLLFCLYFHCLLTFNPFMIFQIVWLLFEKSISISRTSQFLTFNLIFHRIIFIKAISTYTHAILQMLFVIESKVIWRLSFIIISLLLCHLQRSNFIKIKPFVWIWTKVMSIT